MKSILRAPIVQQLAGLLLIMIAPYYSLFLATWCGFACIFIPVYKQPEWRRDFITGYAAGVLYWCSRIHSVVPAYGWGMFLKMIFAAGIPWGILLLVMSITSKHFSATKNILLLWLHALLPGATWLGMMYLYHLTPVDSFPLELMFYQPLPLLQISVLGGYGLMIFLILVFNTSLALSVVHRKIQTFLPGAIAGVLSITIALWGWNRLETNPRKEGDVRIALIQTNFPVSMDWRLEHKDEILTGYEDMAIEASKNDVEMIIFPQYSLNTLISDEETIERFGRLARQTKTTLALGTFTLPTELNPETYNIAYVFDADGELAGTYKAMENLPFRKIGEAFGTTYDPIPTPVGNAGVLLCYEDVIRKVSVRWNEKDIDYFMVLTNPNTFASPLIHSSQLIQDQLRAIETGKEIVRVSANGPSGVVDAFGRFRAITGHEERTILYSTVSPSVQ